jgi:hypothetical protein
MALKAASKVEWQEKQPSFRERFFDTITPENGAFSSEKKGCLLT